MSHPNIARNRQRDQASRQARAIAAQRMAHYSRIQPAQEREEPFNFAVFMVTFTAGLASVAMGGAWIYPIIF